MFRANFCPSSGAQDCATLLLSESLPTTTRRHYTICCKKSQSCAPEVGQNFARNMFSLFTYQTFQWLYFHEASVYTLSHNCRTSCRNSNFRDFTKKKIFANAFSHFSTFRTWIIFLIPCHRRDVFVENSALYGTFLSPAWLINAGPERLPTLSQLYVVHRPLLAEVQ